MSYPFINKTKEGIFISVVLAPRAKQTKVVGVFDGALKISVKAAPIEGRANEALIEFLGKWLNLPKSALELDKGQTSKRKRVRIVGISSQMLEEKVFEVLNKLNK